MGKEKSEKNQFVKILEIFENFDEVAFLDFVRTEWAEFALSTYRDSFLKKNRLEHLTASWIWALIL